MSLLPLLSAAARGDAGARDRLLAALYPSVAPKVHTLLERDYRTHNRWVLPLFSTNDIVQDLLLGLLAELEGSAELPEDEEGLAAFLAARIKNRIVDRIRFHTRQRRDVRRQVAREPSTSTPLAGGAHGPSASRCTALEERFGIFEQALLELDEKDARLWELRFEREAPFEDVANELGYKNAESARAAFRALRAKLAVRLRRLGIQPEGEDT